MEEMRYFYYGSKEAWETYDSMAKDRESHPDLMNNPKFYEFTREEALANAAKVVSKYYELFKEKYFINYEAPYHPWTT